MLVTYFVPCVVFFFISTTAHTQPAMVSSSSTMTTPPRTANGVALTLPIFSWLLLLTGESLTDIIVFVDAECACDDFSLAITLQVGGTVVVSRRVTVVVLIILIVVGILVVVVEVSLTVVV